MKRSELKTLITEMIHEQAEAEELVLQEGFKEIFKKVKDKLMDIPGLSNKKEVTAANKKKYTALVAELEKFIEDNAFKKYAKDRAKLKKYVSKTQAALKDENWDIVHKNIEWIKNYFAKLPNLKKYQTEGTMNEGQYGPGTSKNISLKSKAWKASVGAIENKKRPEAVYITFSTWVKPKMSVMKARASATSDPETLAVITMMEFKKSLNQVNKKLSSVFDDSMFDASSIIFTYDFAEERAKPGKRQFVEFEINIDTVNNIDTDGNPVPNKKTGVFEEIPFADFVKPTEAALNKILKLDIFDEKRAIVDFAIKKGK